ncbi:MAG: sulfite exporter TauE/SafE family protein [Opitutaceae bacterium]|nr:sulfite exporter TauE/SafE family protein [Opitutaceae bacterium]
MDLSSAFNSPAAALAAGLVTSLHCVGMCGPLACALMPGPQDRADGQAVSTVYHLTRMAGYVVLGAAAGGVGSVPLSYLSGATLRYLPWLLVFFFVAVAVRFDQRLPRVPWLGRIYGWLGQKIRGRSRLQGATILGFFSPVLPCGPLYLLVAFALMSGSALKGAETLLLFALGTVPLLWFAQTNYHWLRVRLGPVWLARTQSVMALMVAVGLAWRLRATLGFDGPSIDSFLCCH